MKTSMKGKKVGKLNFIIIRFCSVKDAVKIPYRKVTRWKKNLQDMYLIKDLYKKYTKILRNLSTRKWPNYKVDRSLTWALHKPCRGVSLLSWEDPLEEGMATHSRILAWRIPWTEEPGGLYSLWGCKESDKTEQLSIRVEQTPPHQIRCTGDK